MSHFQTFDKKMYIRYSTHSIRYHAEIKMNKFVRKDSNHCDMIFSRFLRSLSLPLSCSTIPLLLPHNLDSVPPEVFLNECLNVDSWVKSKALGYRKEAGPRVQLQCMVHI